MVAWIPPEDWLGIEAAFNNQPVKWENYPSDTVTRIPGTPTLPGIHAPDRWNHFRKGHKIGRVMAVWYKIDKQYNRALIKQLDKLWPIEYSEARSLTGWQKLNFCYYYHNVEGVNRAVCQIIDEAVEEALAPFRPMPAHKGRKSHKRRYHAIIKNDMSLSMLDLCEAP